MMASDKQGTSTQGELCNNAMGRVALQLRDDKPHVGAADCWGLFGGHSEPGETPDQTIRREILEELDIK